MDTDIRIELNYGDTVEVIRKYRYEVNGTCSSYRYEVPVQGTCTRYLTVPVAQSFFFFFWKLGPSGSPQSLYGKCEVQQVSGHLRTWACDTAPTRTLRSQMAGHSEAQFTLIHAGNGSAI